MRLTSLDSFITLLYFCLILVVGHSLRLGAKSGEDFLFAPRSLSPWTAAFAFLVAGIGIPLVIGLAALSAGFGLLALAISCAAILLSMLLASSLFAPALYSSGARSLPHFLGIRFDRRTRALAAIVFVAAAAIGSSLSIAMVAHIVRSLRILDGLFHAMGWPPEAVFILSAVVPVSVTLVFVASGGLRAVAHGIAIQFALVVAGLLPLVVLGLQKIGGWHGFTESAFHSALPPSLGGLALVAVLLACASWCTDPRCTQFLLAARDLRSARRAPRLAIFPALLLIPLIGLPGILAVGLPTPHTTSIVRRENGAIFHETTVVRREVEQGRGLVPARLNPDGNLARDASGQPLLDYPFAMPGLLQILPNGLLGLGVTALVAALMCGLSAATAAVNTVFVADLYRPLTQKTGEKHLLLAGRWTAAAFLLLSLAVSWFISASGNLVGWLLLAAYLGIPLFFVALIGILWKRAHANGAFCGLLAGLVAPVVFLSLPVAAKMGSGRLAAFPVSLSQVLWLAVIASGAVLLTVVPLSLLHATPSQS